MTDRIVSAGDAVKVFDVNGHRNGQPEDGWDGTVLKVGRVLVHIDYPGWPEDRLPQSFHKDTGQASYPDSSRWFEVPDRTEREQLAAVLTDCDENKDGA